MTPGAPAAPTVPATPAVAKPAAASGTGNGACLALADAHSLLAQALRATTFGIGPDVQALTEVKLTGLSTVGDDRVWRLVGGRPEGALNVEQAAVLVARLTSSGLFARVTPAIRLSAAADGGALLEIALTENAILRSLELVGATEVSRDEILEALLVVPDADDEHEAKKIRRHRRDRKGGFALACPAPVPPRAWLARVRNGQLAPGLVWQGLDAAIERVQVKLLAEGYRLGRVGGVLSPQGKLTLTIDEGRLTSVEIRGVHPRIVNHVRELLGIAPGAVFNVDDLDSGVEQVEREYPFLSADSERRPAPPSLTLTTETRPDGATSYQFQAGPPRCEEEDLDEIISSASEEAWRDGSSDAFRRAIDRFEVSMKHKHDDDDDDDDDDDYDDDLFDGDDDGDDDGDEDCASRWSFYQLEDHKLIVVLEADRIDLDGDFEELLRHTQVTGFAPGAILTLQVWDPANRAHFAFDTLFNVNTARSSLDIVDGDALEELSAAQRIDFIVQPSLIVPDLGLAQLGVQLHAFTDTDDAWRTTRLDSYLNSMFWDRADREYYRRTGVGAFATFHFFDSLTIGGEYRYDLFESMPALNDTDSFWALDPPFPNPPIKDGTYGSVLARLEWSTRDTTIYDVDSVRRPSNASIVELHGPYKPENGLRTVNTFQLADQGLGGDNHFWRFDSDNVLSLATGDDQAVFLRVRVGGGEDQPAQQQEALGGWGSLRGYDFKEFRGDWSALGSLEYRFSILSAFIDVGAVHQVDDWAGPNVGLGTALNLGDSAQLAFAWRTDDSAEAEPEIRLLFGRPW